MTKTWVEPTKVAMGDLIEDRGRLVEVLAVLHGVAGVTLYLDAGEAFYPKGEWTFVAVTTDEREV